MPAKSMDELVALCKRRGFIFQSSDIYGGLQGVYDYGPLGVELKNNLKATWWSSMVYERDDIEGLDAAILTNPVTLKLSPATHQTENAVTGQGDAAYNLIDINSNGFKLRTANGASNVNDKWLAYWAWAEEPFVTSSGVPATAR